MNKITVISAVWCPSCLIVKKHLKRLKSEFPDLIIQELDYDFDFDEVKGYGETDILPVIIFNDKRVQGEVSYEEIRALVERG